MGLFLRARPNPPGLAFSDRIATMLARLKRLFRLTIRASTVFLWKIGYFRLARRWLQRRTLTVTMFHRVLPLESDEYRHAEREYAIGVDEFEFCLRYFKDHYNVVSLGDVEAAVDGKKPLPDHALLITFDDGWRDNLVNAGPVLDRLGLSATIFVNTDALEQPDARWWEDALVEIGRTRPEAFESLCGQRDFTAAARALQAWPLNERLVRLQKWLSFFPVQRQMLTPEDLATVGATWDIGSHGATHVAMPLADDLEAELQGSAAKISAWSSREVRALAFPYGRFNDEVAKQALARYKLVFTTKEFLNRTEPAPSRMLGRIHISPGACRDPDALGHLLCARLIRRLKGP